jgi:uncharacterized protein YbjT (DUF2867 family)
MKIIILGGTGFVGRHLVQRLAGLGHQLEVLSRNPDIHPVRLMPPGVAVQRCNVYDPEQLARHFDGAGAVINLVGILNERGDSGRGFHHAHVELTGLVVEACQRAGVPRLLQMSALNAGRGRSHYLVSRGEAEALVKASDRAWTIFQPSVIFGPGDGLFCRFASLLRLAPVLPIARADAKFAPVWVGDVVEAFVRSLEDPRTHRQVYELYGPDVFTLKDIVRMTARTLGLRRWVIALPDPLGRLQAEVGEWIPGKPISRDNFRSLKVDSVGGIDGLHRLGIAATPVAAKLPLILGTRGDRQEPLDRYRRRNGRD